MVQHSLGNCTSRYTLRYHSVLRVCVFVAYHFFIGSRASSEAAMGEA